MLADFYLPKRSSAETASYEEVGMLESRSRSKASVWRIAAFSVDDFLAGGSRSRPARNCCLAKKMQSIVKRV